VSPAICPLISIPLLKVLAPANVYASVFTIPLALALASATDPVNVYVVPLLLPLNVSGAVPLALIELILSLSFKS
jgi:hypothetical protein